MATYYSRSTTASITAQNTFTDWVALKGTRGEPNTFSVSLADEGSWSGTWTVQARRRIQATAGTFTSGTAIDINSATAAGVYTAQLVGDWEIRVGCKTGNYTAGTATVSVER